MSLNWPRSGSLKLSFRSFASQATPSRQVTTRPAILPRITPCQPAPSNTSAAMTAKPRSDCTNCSAMKRPRFPANWL
jgi:hypothetical protein